MIIRSQDKSMLVPSERFVLSATVDGFIVFTPEGTARPSEIGVLGRYESRERAIKVLDRIQHFYIVGQKNFVYDMPGE